MLHVSDAIRSTRNEDGGVVLDIEHGTLLRLNSTGALIFEWLREGDSESQIAVKIAEKFGVSQETAVNDLNEFLNALNQHHLLL